MRHVVAAAGRIVWRRGHLLQRLPAARVVGRKARNVALRCARSVSRRLKVTRKLSCIESVNLSSANEPGSAPIS